MRSPKNKTELQICKSADFDMGWIRNEQNYNWAESEISDIANVLDLEWAEFEMSWLKNGASELYAPSDPLQPRCLGSFAIKV